MIIFYSTNLLLVIYFIIVFIHLIFYIFILYQFFFNYSCNLINVFDP